MKKHPDWTPDDMKPKPPFTHTQRINRRREAKAGRELVALMALIAIGAVDAVFFWAVQALGLVS